MNIINSFGTMLFGILTMSTIILVGSAPLSSYERKTSMSDDRPKIFLLLDQRRPEVENDMLSSNDFGLDVMRSKRIGSLSIVNNLDVLRQRVMLELARMEALQNQRQIDQNRRILEDIGKRSDSDYVSGANRTVRSDSKTSRNRSAAFNRIEWMSEDEPLYRGSQEDRLSKMRANELHLL
ncbi:diuretic hormone 44 [Pseudomyrmex gracilis]|uniref:diuretic hormone 44 n=1 Tax=Pseudomyrmex gracilis TaxID=219809 RepID=UPI000994C955|nr:diuretic hormone 44 [Pseudomyrmex gracilis]XP_020283318.1 diuretic hormone 44 [Pseudomyrmex gracilis]XP_020283320.1 diuretic hormone 44 [Pseudomyrmex gracilis]XP_020283321.1 diuretic hormone 44 [Pseudomyrmex gracilis]